MVFFFKLCLTSNIYYIFINSEKVQTKKFCLCSGRICIKNLKASINQLTNWLNLFLNICSKKTHKYLFPTLHENDREFYSQNSITAQRHRCRYLFILIGLNMHFSKCFSVCCVCKLKSFWWQSTKWATAATWAPV